jgi:hypothetical protein
VVIDSCGVSQMEEAISRTNSKLSTVTTTGTHHNQIGGALFIGVANQNVSVRDNLELLSIRAHSELREELPNRGSRKARHDVRAIELAPVDRVPLVAALISDARARLGRHSLHLTVVRRRPVIATGFTARERHDGVLIAMR